MLSKNNSSPEVCVNNLMQITRGEVPYDRVKGVSSEFNNGTITQASDEIVEDAEWMLETYEPRAEVDSIDVAPIDAVNGHFKITANINITKEANT